MHGVSVQGGHGTDKATLTVAASSSRGPANGR
jgi:hypothetical protein